MVLDESRTRTLRTAITIALIILLLLLILIIKGCPACERLTKPQERSETSYPTEQTTERARILNTHDFNCMVNLCTNDCAGNETGPTRMAECRKSCSSPEMIQPNSEKYTQCRK
jgi:hypothetical protein